MAVRRFFDAAMRRFRPRGGGRLPAFEAILRMNRFYVASYAANAELLRRSSCCSTRGPNMPVARPDQ